MRRRLFRALAVLGCLAAPSLALAQKQCEKCIPCGWTCISATKTCRVGSAGSAKAETASTSRAAGAGAWIASAQGKTYYRAGCGGARKLMAANRISFKSEKEAETGYQRSKQKGWLTPNRSILYAT